MPRRRRSGRGRQRGCVNRKHHIVLETLEDRRLLAIVSSLSPLGVLHVENTQPTNEQIQIDIEPGATPFVRINGQTTAFRASDVMALEVRGNAGDDQIDLRAVTPETLSGLGGVDSVTVHGRAGNDTVWGSEFADLVWAGSGNDLIFGNRGDDVLRGGRGIDSLHGEQGDDSLSVDRLGTSQHGFPDVVDVKSRIDGSGVWISARFDQPVDVDASALTVMEVTGPVRKQPASSFRYDPSTLIATWQFPRVGSADRIPYELHAAGIVNEFGEILDGDADGIAGGAFRGVVFQVPPAFTNSLRSTAVPQVVGFEPKHPLGNYSRISHIEIGFDADVRPSADPSDLVLHHAVTGQSFTPRFVSVETDNSISWHFDPPLTAPGNYTATLHGGGLSTEHGVPLAGDFENPGSDYRRVLQIALPGDLNLDGLVAVDEVQAIIDAIGRAGSWKEGDLDANGMVTPVDAHRAVSNLDDFAHSQSFLPLERMSGGNGDDTFLLVSPLTHEHLEIADASGRDTLDFSEMNHGRGLTDFQLGATQQTVTASTGRTLTLQTEPGSIDNVIGTRYDDRITGDDLDNSLHGGGGHDRLVGGTGDDSLFGGVGDDAYVFAGMVDLGADLITELDDEGFDTVDVTHLLHADSFSLAESEQTVGSTLILYTSNGVGLAASLEAVLGSELSVQSHNLSVTANDSFLAPIASFSDLLAGASPGEYSATIDWGDGGESLGLIAKAAGGQFLVRGGHSYGAEGSYAVTISVHRGLDQEVEVIAEMQVYNTIIDVSSTENGQLQNAIIAQDRLTIDPQSVSIQRIQTGRASKNEIQQIERQENIVGGEFTLSFEGDTSDAIPWNASAETMQDRLVLGIDAFTPDDISVSETPRGWLIEFRGQYAEQNVSQLGIDATNLRTLMRGLVEHRRSNRRVEFFMEGDTSAMMAPGPVLQFRLDERDDGVIEGAPAEFTAAFIESMLEDKYGVDGAWPSDFSVYDYRFTDGFRNGQQESPEPIYFFELGFGIEFTGDLQQGGLIAPEGSVYADALTLHDENGAPYSPTVYEAQLRGGIYSPGNIVSFSEPPGFGSFRLQLTPAIGDEFGVLAPVVNEYYWSQPIPAEATAEEIRDILLNDPNLGLDDVQVRVWDGVDTSYWDPNRGILVHNPHDHAFRIDLDWDFRPGFSFQNAQQFGGLITAVDDSQLEGSAQRMLVELTQSAAVPRNEVQRITPVTTATGPILIKSHRGSTEAAVLQRDDSAAEVQQLLEPLFGGGNVSVTGPAGGPWEVEFMNGLQHQSRPLLADGDGLVDIQGHVDWGDGTVIESTSLQPTGPFWSEEPHAITFGGSHQFAATGNHVIGVSTNSDSSFTSLVRVHESESPADLPPVITAPEPLLVGSDQRVVLPFVVMDDHSHSSEISLRASGLVLHERVVLGNTLLEFIVPDDFLGPVVLTASDPAGNVGTVSIPLLRDDDRDGMTDEEELLFGTDPNYFDSDGDLLADGFEFASSILDPLGEDPLDGDHDGDGLTNFFEQIFQLDPDAWDTDGDGYSDGQEVATDSNPGSQASTPPAHLEKATDVVKVTLTVGDHSGSESERYDLVVGRLVHQAPTFGEVETETYPLEKGKSYAIEIHHRGTKLETADYDYTAEIELAAGEDHAIFIRDEDEILGRHWESDEFYAERRYAEVYVPKIDLVLIDHAGEEVAEEDEEETRELLLINNDDDDLDGILDQDDDRVRGEDDLLKFKLKPIEPKDLAGEVSLEFNPDEIKLWRNSNRTNPIEPGAPIFDAAKEVTFWAEGLVASTHRNEVEIKATFHPQESQLVSSEGEVTDAVKFSVGRLDVVVDGMNDRYEHEPGAIVWRNNDFSKKIQAVDQPLANLPLFLPDYSAAEAGQENQLDPAYLDDFAPGSLALNPWMVDDYDVQFDFDEELINVWAFTEWDGMEAVGPGRYKIQPHELLTPTGDSLDFWIEGLGRSESLGADVLSVKLFSKDDGEEPMGDDVASFTVLEVGIGVDGNRDGHIDYSNNHDRRLLFWYNNDHEVKHDNGTPDEPGDDFEREDAQVALEHRDHDDYRIANRRDLEDFAPLNVYMDESLEDIEFRSSAVPGELSVEYELFAALSSTDGGIRLYEAHDEQDILGHVRDGDSAHRQVVSKGDSLTTDEFGTSNNISHVMSAGENRYLLEGYARPSPGGAPLPAANFEVTLKTTVTYPNGQTTESTQSVDLTLRDITNFYDRYDIQYLVAGGDGRHNLAFNHWPDPTLTHAALVGDEPFFDADEAVVFVHGWNNTDGQNHSTDWKKAAAETTYKRLYWQGYQGRLVSFHWPTFADVEGSRRHADPQIGPLTNLTYNASEYQAWRSGNALKNLTAALPTSKKHLIAHSMGNVVAAEALRLWSVDAPGIPLVDTYVAMEAAVSAGVYGYYATDAFDITLHHLWDPLSNSFFDYTWPREYYSSSIADLYGYWHAGGPSSSGSLPWMAGADSAAETWVNIYNPMDRLTSEAWRFNNLFKHYQNQELPDHPPEANPIQDPQLWGILAHLGIAGIVAADNPANLLPPVDVWSYRYVLEWDTNSNTNRYYRVPYNQEGAFSTDRSQWMEITTERTLGQPSPESYEILAFLSQANSSAVGNVSLPWFDRNKSLAELSNQVNFEFNEAYYMVNPLNHPAIHGVQFNFDASSNHHFWEYIANSAMLKVSE